MSDNRPLLPKRVVEQGFICARRRSDVVLRSAGPAEPRYEVTIFRHDPTKGAENPMGWVILSTVMLQFDVPQDNPLQKEIDELERLKRETLAKAQAQANQYQAAIDNLLAIEHKPEVPDEA